MSLRIGSVILLLHFIIAATGPFWAPYGPAQIQTGPPLSGMSWQHPFGVDQLGRDVFSRAVYGGHIVILLSLSGTFLGLVIGAIVGLFSGYVGGWIDEVLQRLLEAMISIPFLVLALIAIVAAGPGALRQSGPAGPRRGADLFAAHRAHGAGSGARHRHPRLRHGGAAPGRKRLVGHAARAAAQCDQRAAGRVCAARRLCADPDRLARVSSASACARRRRNGA